MSKLNAALPSVCVCSGPDGFLLPEAEVALLTALVPTLLVSEVGPSGYSWANQLLYSPMWESPCGAVLHTRAHPQGSLSLWGYRAVWTEMALTPAHSHLFSGPTVSP